MTLHLHSTSALRVLAIVIVGIGNAGRASAQLPSAGQVALNGDQIAASTEALFEEPAADLSSQNLAGVTSQMSPQFAGQVWGPGIPRPPAMLIIPPTREIGVHLGLLAFTGGIVGTAGVSYTRSLSDAVAIEGALEIGHGSGTATVRALVRHYNPDVGEVFGAIGFAEGVSTGDPTMYPRGPGLSAGVGAQPRLSSHVALRGEVQLMQFPHKVVGLRLTTGFLIGFN